MRGLPRKYAKMGFAKGWREYRKDHPYKKKLYTVQAYQKTNKGRTTKRKVLGVKKVAKRRRRYTRKRYRRRKPKIPFEIIIAGGAVPFTPTKDGWWSPYQHFQAGDPVMGFRHLAKGFVGFGYDGVDNIGDMINPFNMNSLRYTKMLIYAGIISKIRKKLIRIPFDRVLLVGKYIS